VPDDSSDADCPNTTFSAALGSGVSVEVDFGSGCNAFLSEDLYCAGSAAGAVSAGDRSLELTLDGLTCDDDALTGAVDASFEVATSSVTLEGSFELSSTDAEDGTSLSVDGVGSVAFDRQEKVTTITTFEGSALADGVSYAVGVDGVTFSLLQNQSLTPYAGTVGVTGSDIRDLTVRFLEDSPATGEIEVAIGNGPYFTVSLDDL
jgi:hypothetical protein